MNSNASTALRGVADPTAQRIVSSFTDLVLVVDPEGSIVDVSAGSGLEDHPGWQKLSGQPWVDVLLGDSKMKVEQLLAEVESGQQVRSREMNLRIEGLGEVPFRFTGTQVDDDHIIALGVDIRPVAELQQRMVSAQQAMEIEYDRLRQSEAQYRVLFHVSPEGVVFAKGGDTVIMEANPAAAKLLGLTADSLRGKVLGDLFDEDSRVKLTTMLESVRAGRQVEVLITPKGSDGVELSASAAMFRQGGSPVALFRFWPVGEQLPLTARDSRMLQVLDAMPDAFVVTGEDLRVLGANLSFCEMVQRGEESQVVGQSLDRWLGRPGVDLNIILSNLREHGLIRNFSTVVRGDFGAEQGVAVTAVTAPECQVPCFGFVIRPITASIHGRPGRPFQARSAEQLQELVGRVSLKEIVQESSDLIERLCIEAALDLSGNNRAAAAQLLGLSRQSLYSKLRRHGMEEFQPS